jgi:hypothetical protein|tara:strand:- start:3066 stop:3263 length:198 start_codon:yes stop_codon:yes gene_type:complete
MKKRDIWLLGGLVLIGVGVYISRKQTIEKQNKLVLRGGKWIFPDRQNPSSFPTYLADPKTGSMDG